MGRPDRSTLEDWSVVLIVAAMVAVVIVAVFGDSNDQAWFKDNALIFLGAFLILIGYDVKKIKRQTNGDLKAEFTALRSEIADLRSDVQDVRHVQDTHGQQLSRGNARFDDIERQLDQVTCEVKQE